MHIGYNNFSFFFYFFNLSFHESQRLKSILPFHHFYKLLLTKKVVVGEYFSVTLVHE